MLYNSLDLLLCLLMITMFSLSLMGEETKNHDSRLEFVTVKTGDFFAPFSFPRIYL